MQHYFEGLMRQTGLKFGTSPTAVVRRGEQAAQSVPALESERRVLVDPVLPAASEPTESSTSPPGVQEAPGRAERGFESQTTRPEETDQEVVTPPRASGSVGTQPSASLGEMGTLGREIEVDSRVTHSAPEAMEEDSSGPGSTIDALTGKSEVLHGSGEIVKTEAPRPGIALRQNVESASTPAPEQGEPVLVEERAQPKARLHPHTLPEPTSGQDVVRQVLEWIGEDELQTEAAIDTESAEPTSRELTLQGRAIEPPESVASQDTVVEQQQSLHLSIGSIVMTVEGSPSSVELQPDQRRNRRPTPAPAPEPPVRLSRHYLRLR